MFPMRKSDVDKHVEECLKKINNETERNLRCLSFAKQYFKIERYEEARRYVSTYLSARPNSAEGHCLLGKCLEALGRKEAALQAYKSSLRLDPKQNNLVLKVCEILATEDVALDLSGARYFCEMAQSFDPHNSIIFNLKQRIFTTENDDPQEISNLILKELETRPTDIKMRVRLLKHLLQYNNVKEAYKHAAEIESKDIPIFNNNITWYEAVAEVIVKYQKNASLQNSMGWEFWFFSVSILDKIASLTLSENTENIKPMTEYINALFNFDQTLTKAALNITDCPDKHLIQEFLNHYSAQLCFHLATLVFKQAQKDLFKYKEASNVTLPLLFAAYHSQPPDLQSMWFNHAPENRRNMVRKWRKEAAFRCSQVGHILQAAAKDRKSILLEKANQYSVGMWREQLYKKLFITRDQQLKMKTSYFLSDQTLLEIVLRLPESTDLLKYDEEAQLIYPDSLHHHIWIALNNKLSDFKCSVFEGLQYSIKNLKNCGAETLNVLDIQAFIYCATLCAKYNQENIRNVSFHNLDKPNVLPAAVTQQLGTLNQNTFFKAAYKMYKNEYDSALDQLRLTLVDGIKTLRCVDNSLDVKLLVTLAQTFAECSKNCTKQSEIEFNENRAELYWKAALPILEKMKNNQAVSYPPNKLFNYRSRDIPLGEICVHIETGKLFNGCQLMKKKDYEKALRTFETLRDPYASFYQAQIYKLMADQQTSQNKENVTSEMRSQNIILLSRARDCLYLTLDRLREPSVDQKHPLNEQLGGEIEKIERLLSRIDPDCTNRNECDGMSDDNVSSPDSTGDHYITGYTGSTSYFNSVFTPRGENHNSTPYRSDLYKREAKPSPERLDAQLRQLAVSKDAAINHILEHNKMMMESQKNIVDELRSFKDAVNNLTATVEELKTMKHSYEELKEVKQSVNELKASVDELDSFKNITDMVYEMKKELGELRKEVNKTGQLTDEDIYGLANEYGAEYNLNSNLAAYNSNLYSNYQARMPGTPLYGPPALYPGIYPPMAAAAAYTYGGLGLPQFQDQQLPTISGQDFRTISAALSQVQPPVSYGQTTLPTQAALFRDPKVVPSTSQSVFPTIGSTAVTTTPTSKAPPVNVVITASDPLPTTKVTTSQPILSVTIPPQHLKGNIPKVQPHNYQIPLPTSTVVSTSPSVLSKPPPAISTQSILSNVAPPVYSAVADKTPTNVSLGLQIEKSLEQTFNTSKNESYKSNISSSSIEEHDPCPDFKPIIPLPDEVPVVTGEENDVVLFCERAKLFRYVTETKEWKERGVGNLKILKNPETKKVRILMRRDQVHKICANHFITKDMTLTPMPKSDRAYIWAAQDYADEKVVVEKLCVRFKTSEEAKKFYDAFEAAKKSLDEKVEEKPASSLGGFVFTSTPCFKPKEEPVVAPVSQVETTKPSPFSNFVFGHTKTISFPTFQNFSPVQKTESPKPKEDDESEEFVPTAEFKPVVPLPELVDVKTGEENCEVLFENRVKLFRIDPTGETKEFKEKGVGVIKLIKDTTTVRLVMRRDQVFKVCCNHQLLKNMEFKEMKNNPKALTWCAKDFSEGVLTPETFAIRFKTEELMNEFLKAVQAAQDSLDENNCLSAKHQKTEPVKPIGFGDKFKPAKGSWECKNCFVMNDGKANYCLACETPKNDTIPKKSENDASGAAFSFGVGVSNSWGNAFKPKEGSWECKSCYIRNDSDKTHCMSCESPKDDTISKKEPEKGISLDTGGLKFNFGTPKPAIETKTSGWGDMFKPKVGSWECKNCLIQNNSDVVYCVACESPKDETIPKKEASKGVNLETGGPKFTFGMPETTTEIKTSGWGDMFKPKEGSWECKNCLIQNNSDVVYCVACESPKDETIPKKEASKGVNLDTGGPKFTFGVPKPATETTKTSGWGDMFKPKEGSWECKNCLIRNNSDVVYCMSCESPKDDTMAKKEASKGVNLDTPGQKYTFGFSSTQVNSGAKATFTFGQSSISTEKPFVFKPEKQDTPNKFVFGSPQKHDFEFTPRSPRRISSGGKDEESDASFVEEECDNIYFKPVIPLPDKVEVKTGEEEEEVLYCHRAKLYRFVDKEWKERGLGDLKILKRKDNGKLRVLMRREQVFKICLNHILTSDIKYLPKDDKTWLFYASDYSEGELANEQFCLRFKTAEIAQEFMKAVNDALSGEISDTGKKPEEKPEVDDDEVEFISETKVTPEEEKEALKLKLPPKFMSYRQLPDCECQQCKKDDEYLNDFYKKPDQTSVSQIFKSTPPSISTSSSASSIFTTPKDETASFKSADSSTTLKSLLSKPSLVVTPKTTSSLFASPVFGSENSSVFSSPTTTSNLFTSKSTSIFQTVSDNKPQPFMLSSKPTESVATSKSTGTIFGNSGNLDNKNNSFMFADKPTESSGIFGSATSKSTGSIFGNSTNVFGSKSTPVFGGFTTTSTPSASVFSTTGGFKTGGSLFTTPSPNPTGSIFGGSPAIFGKDKPIFGGGDNLAKSTESPVRPVFGATITNIGAKTTNLKEEDKAVLDADSGISFASLAAKSTDKPAFAKENADSGNPFGFLGAGAPVFGSADKNKSAVSEEGEGGGDEEYDPHYDPIVPLPDAIVVSTGEEDEAVLFNERAKLYRYDADNKEWKERGVGQMKILHHPVNNTYRFLLRREQVHKVVLNQLIIPDLELQPMTTSDKAWVWGGYNYTDDGSALEKLAVRFKNCDLAQNFYSVVQDVLEKVKQAQLEKSKTEEEIDLSKLIPSSIQNFGVEDVSGDEQRIQEVYEDEVEEEEDEDDDDDDRTVMFMKRCTLSEEVNGEWKVVSLGDLQVYYDPDLYAARICITNDNGEVLSNTLIEMNTFMELDKNSCVWKAIEYDTDELRARTLKATFSSVAAAQEFHSNYLEGLHYAQEYDVNEIPVMTEEETDH